MAGHSKWAQIKRTKAVVDAKRGAVFTRLAREIIVAARNGADPAGNFQLRTAIAKARAAGVPNANIDRAIAKGSGHLGGEGNSFEAVRYEGYGAGGVAVLVEALTDNRNRTAADLRLAFGKFGGNLGETGCVGYLFEQRSVARIEAQNLNEDDLLDILVDLEGTATVSLLGYEVVPGGAEVFAPFTQLEVLQDGLRGMQLNVTEWEHRWCPQTSCTIGNPEQLCSCLKMLDALEALDDVRSLTTNLEVDEELIPTAMG